MADTGKILGQPSQTPSGKPTSTNKNLGMVTKSCHPSYATSINRGKSKTLFEN
jgi:hypothetical protein